MEIKTYTLKSPGGATALVSNLGCAIIKLEVPGKDGKLHDVVLGLDTAEDYLTKTHPFFGVVAGRVANRIGYGKFTLGGKEYQLEINNGQHHLHGGLVGFDKKAWEVEDYCDNKIVFVYNSPDGEENYPGNLTARVTYTFGPNNNLRIDYHVTTDTQTICNLTNHSYFNLEGYNAPNIYNNHLKIVADKITAVDTGLIPTGEFVSVAGTPFDFNTSKPIGADLEAAGEANNTGGYDHNFVLTNPNSGEIAKAYSPVTGIAMAVYSNSPGVQLYTGNAIPPGVVGKGVTYGIHSGFCLETQLFPDAINKPNFPSAIVNSGTPQQYFTEFVFSVE